VPGLGHDQLQRDALLAEMGGSGVAQLVQLLPGVPGEQDPGAVIAEPGPSGGRAQVLGCGAAGGAGAAFGAEHRPGLAAADEAGQQVRGAGAPADPFGVAALGPDRGAAGVQAGGRRCSAPAPRWRGRRFRRASATGSFPAAARRDGTAPGRSPGRGTARVALRCSRRRSALAGRTGAASRLAAHQDSQAVTAPRLRFQVAGARCPQSCSSRPASSSPLTSASGRLPPSPASSRSSTPV
jgi:hypothetical protein